MIETISQAAKYIDRVGFCLLFPIKGVRLPSLWAAVKGKPPKNFNLVAAWDSDTERLWEWKDQLPRRRLCWFGRFFRGKQSLLSLRFLPCFYRLAGSYGSTFAHHPERQSRDGRADEYEQLYREGKITADARAVCERLHKHGPQAALELRYALGWVSKPQNRRFQRALQELQRRLLIVHWGAKPETHAWESVVYELTLRAFPKAVRAATRLALEEARRRIAAQYRRLVPSATPAEAARLFAWHRRDAEAAFRQFREPQMHTVAHR
jgi:hypothetical protein